MCKVAVTVNTVLTLNQLEDLQHCISLVPFELMLYIHSSLCLNNKADQAQQQKESSICVLRPDR